MPFTTTIGLDGCSRGWVAIAIDDQGFVEAFFAKTFAEHLEHFAEAHIIAVDIPIGLSDSGHRQADLDVRAVLKGRTSTLFVTPPRPALEAESYNDGCTLSRDLTGKAFSRQAWALKKKILEVDAHASDKRLHEVHPELSFQLLAGHPLAYSKKSWGGQRERQALLRKAGIHFPKTLGDVDRIGVDDVVDAAIAAWSARRIARGEAQAFSGGSEDLDRSGRKIAIWG
jgi:predicted RNase H-like nuclease